MSTDDLAGRLSRPTKPVSATPRRPSTSARPAVKAPKTIGPDKGSGGGESATSTAGEQAASTVAAPQAREAPKLYGHRVSLDLPDQTYEKLTRLGFDSGRVPHGTIARHLVALGLDDPEMVAQAVELARADVRAAADARRK
jgi:hypothetical protein